MIIPLVRNLCICSWRGYFFSPRFFLTLSVGLRCSFCGFSCLNHGAFNSGEVVFVPSLNVQFKFCAQRFPTPYPFRCSRFCATPFPDGSLNFASPPGNCTNTSNILSGPGSLLLYGYRKDPASPYQGNKRPSGYPKDVTPPTTFSSVPTRHPAPPAGPTNEGRLHCGNG